MTTAGANAAAPERGSLAPRPNTSSPASAPLTHLAAGLLSFLRVEASSKHPVTQLDAGVALGITGADDTIRRKVQHLRDEINDHGDVFIVSSWGYPAGMWVAENDEQIDEYIKAVLSRSYSTVGQFKGLDKARRQRIVEEIQGVLRLQVDDEEDSAADKSVHASSTVSCAWCEEPFQRSRDWQRFCSEECRMSWHGRSKAS